MTDLDALPSTAIDLLHELVTQGSIVTSNADDHRLRSIAAGQLTDAGFAEVIRGPDKSILRATFAGRRMIVDWRETETRRRTRGR